MSSYMKHLIPLTENWDSIPTIEQLNNLPAMKDVWKGFEMRFVPYKETGSGARKVEFFHKDENLMGRTYIFYPKKGRIEDRYIILNGLKMETLDDWNTSIRKFVYYQAAVELNKVKNDNDPNVAYGYENKRTYNRNKITAMKENGIGFIDLLSQKIFWDNPISKNILIWLLPDSADMAIGPIKKMIDSGVLINYEVIFKELIDQNKILPSELNKLNVQRAKKLSAAANLMKRNSPVVLSRAERIELKNQENLRIMNLDNRLPDDEDPEGIF